jgi:hypothetical protein
MAPESVFIQAMVRFNYRLKSVTVRGLSNRVDTRK